jgi:hypothetical protein
MYRLSLIVTITPKTGVQTMKTEITLTLDHNHDTQTEKVRKLYKFSELSEQAQEKAINDYRYEDNDYFWHRENLESLKEFERLFPVKITSWAYGGSWDRNNHINFVVCLDNEILEMDGLRLHRWFINNYWSYVFEPKQYWICNGHHNCAGLNAKSRKSRISYELASLTGYCLDYDLLKPLADFMEKPDKYSTLEDIFRDCLDSWLKACVADVDYQNSDEYVAEYLVANEYDFDVNGKLA